MWDHGTKISLPVPDSSPALFALPGFERMQSKVNWVGVGAGPEGGERGRRITIDSPVAADASGAPPRGWAS